MDLNPDITRHPLPPERSLVPVSTWSGVSWGAILAGLVSAVAFQVLFMMLGAGLGFAIYSPLTDSNPISELATGAIVIQGVSAVFSLWLGGWIAGRFAPVPHRSRGWLYGLSVWCSTTVAGVLFVSAGAGWALGDLSKIVGGGLSLAAKPAAAAAGGLADMAKDALKQRTDTVASFTEEALGRLSANPPPSSISARAKREVGLALGRFFNPAVPGNAGDRAAVVKALTDNLRVSQSDAETMVGEWSASFERLKADLAAAKDDAELKAKEVAEKAANTLSIFSLGAFVAFTLGAVSASCGGRTGAKVATEHDSRVTLSNL